MTDLSDKARRLIKQLHSLSLVLGSRYQQESAQRVCDDLTAHIAALESVASAAREHDAAVAAQERFDCNHYEPPCKCGDTAAEIGLRAEEAFKKLRESIRRLDGAGEDGDNG